MGKVIPDYDNDILNTLTKRLSFFSTYLGCSAIDIEDFELQRRRVVSVETVKPTFEEEIPKLVDMINLIKNKLLELGLGFKLIYLTNDISLRANSKESIATSIDIYTSFNLIDDIIYFLPNEYLSFEMNKHDSKKIMATNKFILGTAMQLAMGKSETPLPGLKEATFKMYGEIRIPKGTLIGLAINKQILDIKPDKILNYIP